MRISKSWTRVTTLSKRIALIMFIGLPFFGFYLGYSYRDQLITPLSSSTTINMTPPSSPEKTVQNFYDWYMNCLETHFSKPNGKPPAENCNYKTSPYVNQKLIDNLAERRGGDAVLCAANTPDSFKVDSAVSRNDGATVVVHTYFSVSGDNPLLVSLESDGRNWLISNVECNR